MKKIVLIFLLLSPLFALPQVYNPIGDSLTMNYIYGVNNVGVGTANPSAKLHINGTLRIVTGSEGAGKVLGSDANGNADWTAYLPMVYPGAGIALSTGSAWGSSITDNSANWNAAYGWGNHASAGYVTGTGIDHYLAKFNGTGAIEKSNIFDDNTNVGIGTTVPGALLDINGTIAIRGGTPGAGKVLTSDANGVASWSAAGSGTVTSIATTSPVIGGTITTTGTIALNTDTLAAWHAKMTAGNSAYGWGDWDTASVLIHWSDTSEVVTKYYLGQVGYLTEEKDPIYEDDSAKILWWLDTTDLIATKYDLDTLSLSGGSSQWTDLVGGIYYNGNVGISSTSPAYALDVVGDIRGDTLRTPHYKFPHVDGTNGQVPITNGSGVVSWGTVTGGSGVSVDSLPWQHTTSRGTIQRYSENVGIGTTAPAQALDVVGSIASTGNIYLPTSTATTGNIYTNNTHFITSVGTNNAFVGQGAGNLTLTGYSNFGMGNAALDALTTGYGNIAVGTDAISDITTQYYNTAIGQGAHNHHLGNNNTAIGAGALITTGAGSGNVAVGINALKTTGTGASNVGIGENAMEKNTSGGYNVAIGYYANAAAAQTGNYNDAIGVQSLENNTSGTWNQAFGGYALRMNTTGANNVGLGPYAGYSNQTGNGNVFLGDHAGYSETGSNKLYISNSNTTTPLIGGTFPNISLIINAPLTISTTRPGSPTTGMMYTSNDTLYKWSGAAWKYVVFQ